VGALRYTGRPCESERGFTLPEVLVTIIILGILAGIAIPNLWSVVEGRRVDSATNQMVGDLRLAHSKASSRLVTHRVCFPSDSATYQIGPQTGPGACDPAPPPPLGPGTLETHQLPDGTETGTTLISPPAIAFCADGTLEAPPTGAVCPGGTAAPSPDPGDTVTITIRSEDDTPSTDIEVNKVTSRVVVQ